MASVHKYTAHYTSTVYGGMSINGLLAKIKQPLVKQNKMTVKKDDLSMTSLINTVIFVYHLSDKPPQLRQFL